MEGEHGKIDMICHSFVTPGLSQMILMKKKNILLSSFFCHLILTLIAHGMVMKLQTLIICSVASLDTLRFTFTPNGKREFVPRDQVFPLIVANCLLLQLTNKKFSRRFYS